MKALLTALAFSVVMVIKKPLAWIIYPFAYLAKDWVYGNDEVKNYTMPKGVQGNSIKWTLWIWLDDDQPTGYPLWYAKEILGYEPITAWDKFKCAYAWSGWRNSAYNVNYYYFGNQSEIVSHKIWFGNYEWNRKLRASNGDNGIQWVWYTTAKGQERFMFSGGIQKLPVINQPLTFFWGWNLDYNGRFSVALKFK